MWASSSFSLLSFLQEPGRTVADTKHDLTVDPLGFLARAAHLWNSEAPLGQVQNQAYGYFFPHGAFFSLGDLLELPAWVTQRLWWALLLTIGFLGVLRLAETLGIGSRGSRVLAAAAFALSPRVITTLGPISSETLPMLLAPWVLLPVVLALEGRGAPRLLAARSAVAVALMGAVNAVATLAAVLIAVIWWAANLPAARRTGAPWRRFTAWWIPCGVLATAWWIVPLVLLGRVSPPFLEYIESAAVTTRWTSVIEVFRGTSSWTPFVSAERQGGAELVGQPLFVLATGMLAALGLAGLLLRGMPGRRIWLAVLLIGLVGMSVAHVGTLDGPFSTAARTFLDGAGSPLRNVHKLEPLLRLPLVLGLAHLLRRAPLPGAVPRPALRRALAHPESTPQAALAYVAVLLVVTVAAPAWTFRLAPAGGYTAVPDHWRQTADWLAEHSGPADGPRERSLVVPGSDFAVQVWGRTRDEPLQPLAGAPWATRDAIPLVPPEAIRALDAVQRRLADGRPSDALAATLAGQGIRFVVVRNDLDPHGADAPRPLLVHRAIAGSPGLIPRASFGEPQGSPVRKVGADDDPTWVVDDAGLRPEYPAVEIFEVRPPAARPAGPLLADLDVLPVVAGGPEAMSRLDEATRAGGADGAADTVVGAPGMPRLLAADAAAAGLPARPVYVTDTPVDRETNYGRTFDNTSAIRSPGDARVTGNRLPDYAVTATGPAGDVAVPRVSARWTGGRITTSGSASDALQAGAPRLAASPAALVDDDPLTAWLSSGFDGAVGRWVRVDLDEPLTSGSVTLRGATDTLGSRVDRVQVRTANGTAFAALPARGEPVEIALPPGRTTWLRVMAYGTVDGTAGAQFGLAELTVRDRGVRVPITRDIVVPAPPAGAPVAGWLLGQDFPSIPPCVGLVGVRCDPSLGRTAEEPRVFARVVTAPREVAVVPEVMLTPRVGEALADRLVDPAALRADGPSAAADVRAGPAAAVDGDPATSWTPADAGTAPGLTVRLPRPTWVSQVRITPPEGPIPAAATRVAITAGAVRVEADVDPEGPATVTLPRTRTDTVTVTPLEWRRVADRSPLGFSVPVAPGLAEVTPLDDGYPVAPSAAPDRAVHIGCDAGAVLHVGETAVPLRIDTTLGALRGGAPVRARPCTDAATDLRAGENRVRVDPGEAFGVASVRLVPAAHSAAAVPAGAPAAVPAPVVRWDDAHRALRVDAVDHDRVLIVPESVNAAWEARLGGTILTPLRVDGWQQGWIIPGGASGVVELTFRGDATYRLALGAGLLLLLPLTALALVPARRRAAASAASVAPRRPSVGPAAAAAVTAGTAAGWLLGGVAALAVTAVVLAATVGAAYLFGRRRTRRAVTYLGFGGIAVAAALLSRSPWPHADYAGAWVSTTLATLVGLAAIPASALVDPASAWAARRRRLARAASRRSNARRAGSSTSA